MSSSNHDQPDLQPPAGGAKAPTATNGREHEIFVRQARDTAHRMLFFLGLLYETGREKDRAALESYAEFALEQVRRLHDRVRPPKAPPTSPTSVEIVEAWKEIGKAFEGPEKTAAPLELGATLRRRAERFLEASLAQSFGSRLLDHRFADGLRFLRKRLAFLILTLAVIGVVRMEAVSSLLWSQPLWTVLTLLFVTAPTFLWLSRIRWRARKTHPAGEAEAVKETVPWWDLGGRPLRSFRNAALEPRRGIQRWPTGAGAATRETTSAAEGGTWRRPSRWLATLVAPAGGQEILLLILLGQLGRLVLTAVWLLLGGILFFASSGGFIAGSLALPNSRLTVYAILALLYTTLVLARIIDLWEFLDHRPIRFLLLGVAALALLGMFVGVERWFFIPLLLAAGFYAFSYIRRRRQGRFRPLRLALAVILLLLAILNLQGMFTQRNAEWRERPAPPALQRLGVADWPHGGPDGPPVVVMAASGGGSRSALYTALTLAELHRDEALRPLARQMQLISSVSGGSLANAGYLARRLGEKSPGTLPEAVKRDFLFPVLVGFVVPGINRGDGIQMAWRGFELTQYRHYLRRDPYECGVRPDREPDFEHTAALANLCLSDVAARWRDGVDEAAPPLPLPLFNATSLDGHRVVISPLAKEIFTRRELHEPVRPLPSRDPRPTWVFDRDGIYGLEDLLGDFDPSLSATVLASANFPFGFPLVRVWTERDLFLSPLREDRESRPHRVELTDGGALSNSGMWSLFNLLVNERKELRQRGVLLLIVEASHMPEYPSSGKVMNLVGTLQDQSPLGQALHRKMLDQLHMLYGPMLAVAQIDLTADEDHNVLTTWALSVEYQESLEEDFRHRWPDEKGDLLRKWQTLEANRNARAHAWASWQQMSAEDRQRLLDRSPGELRGEELWMLRLARERLEPEEGWELIERDRPPVD